MTHCFLRYTFLFCLLISTKNVFTTQKTPTGKNNQILKKKNHTNVKKKKEQNNWYELQGGLGLNIILTPNRLQNLDFNGDNTVYKKNDKNEYYYLTRFKVCQENSKQKNLYVSLSRVTGAVSPIFRMKLFPKRKTNIILESSFKFIYTASLEFRFLFQHRFSKFSIEIGPSTGILREQIVFFQKIIPNSDATNYSINLFPLKQSLINNDQDIKLQFIYGLILRITIPLHNYFNRKQSVAIEIFPHFLQKDEKFRISFTPILISDLFRKKKNIIINATL